MRICINELSAWHHAVDVIVIVQGVGTHVGGGKRDDAKSSGSWPTTL